MKIRVLKHLAKLNVLKFLLVLLVFSLFFSALHFVLAQIFVVYRTEFFEKSGLVGAAIIGVFAGVVGVSAINIMVARAQPRRLTDWMTRDW